LDADFAAENAEIAENIGGIWTIWANGMRVPEGENGLQGAEKATDLAY